MRSRTNGRQRGQALVEFALVLPILLILMLGIGDFSRVYTTTLAVEAGVREGADYGGFESSRWDTTGSHPTNYDKTVAEIQHRVCLATSTLPDYATTDVVNNATCTNPAVSIELLNPDGIDCSASPVPTGKKPCMVHVGAQYDFRLILGGVGVGPVTFPTTIPIRRDAYYVVTDFLEP